MDADDFAGTEEDKQNKQNEIDTHNGEEKDNKEDAFNEAKRLV
jgi:hypothetical protein